MKLGHIISPQFTASFAVLMALKEIPSPIRFRLRAITKMIREAGEDYNTTRSEIVTEHAMRDEKGEIVYLDKDIVKFTPEKQPIVNKALTALLNTDIALPEIRYDDLGPNRDELLGKEIANLEFIVE